MFLADRPMYRRLDEFIEAHNSAQTKAAHRIDKNRAKTLEIVARLALKQARLAMENPAWADSDTIPSVWTSRHELSRLGKYSLRTAYNCLAVLERAGIVQKHLHGWQTAFELVLHPWFVFGDNYPQPPMRDVERELETLRQAAQNQAAPPDSQQNLPPITSIVTVETSIISTNSGVDCGNRWTMQTFGGPIHNPLLVDNSRIDSRKGNEAQIQPENKDFGQEPNFFDEKSGISNRRLQKIISIGQLLPPVDNAKGNETTGEQRTGLTNPSAPVARSAATGTSGDAGSDLRRLAKKLTVQFWERAKEQLWPDEFISEDYERRLLNLIWTDVMGGFRDCDTDSEITTRYFVRLRQLEMATAYARKHGWSGFLPPPLYFSRSQFLKEKQSGKRGSFWWTYEWVREADTRKKERYRKDQLKLAIHSVVAGKAPKGLRNGRNMDRIGLSVYWRNRLARLGDHRILAEFDHLIQQHLT